MDRVPHSLIVKCRRLNEHFGFDKPYSPQAFVLESFYDENRHRYTYNLWHNTGSQNTHLHGDTPDLSAKEMNILLAAMLVSLILLADLPKHSDVLWLSRMVISANRTYHIPTGGRVDFTMYDKDGFATDITHIQHGPCDLIIVPKET